MIKKAFKLILFALAAAIIVYVYPREGRFRPGEGVRDPEGRGVPSAGSAVRILRLAVRVQDGGRHAGSGRFRAADGSPVLSGQDGAVPQPGRRRNVDGADHHHRFAAG